VIFISHDAFLVGNIMVPGLPCLLSQLFTIQRTPMIVNYAFTI